jgi:hypothetical protein
MPYQAAGGTPRLGEHCYAMHTIRATLCSHYQSLVKSQAALPVASSHACALECTAVWASERLRSGSCSCHAHNQRSSRLPLSYHRNIPFLMPSCVTGLRRASPSIYCAPHVSWCQPPTKAREHQSDSRGMVVLLQGMQTLGGQPSYLLVLSARGADL